MVSQKTKSTAPANTLPLWFGPVILLAAFMLTFAMFLWLLRENTYETQRKELVANVELAKESIRRRLDGNRDYLLMMAKERSGSFMNARSFQERASRYVADHPEMICISWVDANYLITDVAPVAPNKQIIGLRLNLPEPKRASHLAMEKRQPAYTRPFEVIQGELAFELWVPVFRDDVFLGLFGGIYSYEKMLRAIVGPETLNTNHVSVMDTSRKILLELPRTGAVDEHLIYEAALDPLGEGVLLRFNGYGRGAIGWGFLSLTFICLALVLGMSYAMWGFKREIERRGQSEAALRESEERYRSLFYNNHTVMLIINPEDGKIEDANPAAASYYGWSIEQLKHKNMADLNTLTLDQIRTEMELARTEQRNRFIFQHRRAHGDIRDVEVFSGPILIDERSLLYSIVIDITERKEYEEEIMHSNAELEQFSYAVSHDMRQPLRMISSYLQLIEMSLANQLVGEKREYFDFAIEGAKRIDQMLVALLEYSRVGRKGEPPTWVESRAMLAEALQFLQPVIAEAQARLSITGTWPRILVSHDEMLRLFQNLIGNAVKYRITGRIPEITISGEILKGEWHLCVADNGVGIIPDQIKRLFKMFQRLHTHAAYEGTGIGLALCRKIAEHHKGRIWAESEGEGLGSKFYVALPRWEEIPHDSHERPGPPAHDPDQGRHGMM